MGLTFLLRPARLVGAAAKILIGQPFVVAALHERIGQLEHLLAAVRVEAAEAHLTGCCAGRREFLIQVAGWLRCKTDQVEQTIGIWRSTIDLVAERDRIHNEAEEALDRELRQLVRQRDQARSRAEKAEREMDNLDLATVQVNAHGAGQESTLVEVDKLICAAWPESTPETRPTLTTIEEDIAALVNERDEAKKQARAAEEMRDLAQQLRQDLVLAQDAARQQVQELSARLALHEDPMNPIPPAMGWREVTAVAPPVHVRVLLLLPGARVGCEAERLPDGHWHCPGSLTVRTVIGPGDRWMPMPTPTGAVCIMPNEENLRWQLAHALGMSSQEPVAVLLHRVKEEHERGQAAVEDARAEISVLAQEAAEAHREAAAIMADAATVRERAEAAEAIVRDLAVATNYMAFGPLQQRARALVGDVAPLGTIPGGLPQGQEDQLDADTRVAGEVR